MTTYPLDALGAEEFERLAQALVKAVVGNGSITFGKGRDGGREATFHGRAPYPSRSEQWGGDWIFQAKYVDVGRAGVGKARGTLLARLRQELARIVRYGHPCDNYILITNVPLSGVAGSGAHDLIHEQIAPAFPQIRNIHVWGYDDVARLLDLNPQLRAAFPSLLLLGDVVLRVLGAAHMRPLDETILLFLATEYQEDRYAQLDQAGDVGVEPLSLAEVFVDLDVRARQSARDAEASAEEPVPALSLLISERLRRTVLIGGPGQGKSTLGQFVAQIHRSMLLGKVEEVLGDDGGPLPPAPRIPFRISLRDFGQWVAERIENATPATVELYLASRVTSGAGLDAPLSADEIREVLRRSPALLILDGLDEVSESALRTRVIREIEAFLERVESALGADVQVIGSSRPTGYGDEFQPQRFAHLELLPLSAERAEEYAQRWIVARRLTRMRADSVRAHYRESAEDPQVRLLLTTPLQVNIVIYVILSGGRPSQQRESLFSDYVDVIYRRERSKPRSALRTDKDTILGLHQYLGYLLHRRASQSHHVNSSLDSDSFRAEVRRYLRHTDPYLDDAKLEQRTDTLVTEARERLVLLVESGPDRFGFELRSLQEYFAAAHLVESARSSEERVARFRAIALSRHWRNVALFFAGRMGRLFRGEAANLLDVCRAVDREPPDRLLRRGSILALALAADRVFGSNASLQRSAIEIAVGRIESDPLAWSTPTEPMLHGLGEENGAEHVTPALAAKLPSVDFDRLVASWQLAREPGVDPAVAIGLLRRYCLGGSPAERPEAFQALVRIAPDSPDAPACARACLEGAPPEAVGRTLGALAAIEPDAFATALGGTELPAAHGRALLRAGAAALSRRSPAARGPAASAPSPSLERPIRAAVIRSFRLMRWMRTLAEPSAAPPRPVYRGDVAMLRAALAEGRGDPLLVDALELLDLCARVADWDLGALDASMLARRWSDVDATLPEVTALVRSSLADPRTMRGKPIALLVDALDTGRGDVATSLLRTLASSAMPGDAWSEAMGELRDLLARSRQLERAFVFGDGELVENDRTHRIAVAAGVPLRDLQLLAGDLFVSSRSGRGALIDVVQCAAMRIGEGHTLIAARLVDLVCDALHTSPSTVPHVWPAAQALLDGVARRRRDADAVRAATALLAMGLGVAVSERTARIRGWLAAIGSEPSPPRRIPQRVGLAGPWAVTLLVRSVAEASRDELRGAAACLALVPEPDVTEATLPPDHVATFLDSGDPTCERAGLRLVELMAGDAVGTLLLSRLDGGRGSPLPDRPVRFASRAIPDDPVLRTRLVGELSAFLEQPGAGGEARRGLLGYLRAVADATEPELAAREAELGLPLAVA